MKRIITVLILFLTLISLSSCTLFIQRTDIEFLSTKLNGLDVSSGKIIYYKETHGGFHGDGDLYSEIKFTDNVVSEKIKQSNDWFKMPLTHNLNVVIYGGEVKGEFGRTETWESFIDEKKIPQITNGYYYFEDRHSDSTNKKDDTDIFKRYSCNFTVAIYDLDTHILYFYAIDT